MKKQLVTASLLALLAASCGHRTDRSTAAPDSSKPAAAASAQATDTAALGPEMLRTYEGLLPAADGPGIRYELTLENREHSGDGTYRLAMTYLEAETDGTPRSFRAADGVRCAVRTTILTRLFTSSISAIRRSSRSIF